MSASILVVGSSIFEFWEAIDSVAPGCRVVNRAVGGTTTAYWAENLESVLDEIAPDLVLFYAGSNDLNAEVPDESIVANVLSCRATLQRLAPGSRLAYFSIIKAPQKQGKWERIDRIDAEIRARLSPGDLFVESNDVFFPDGRPAERFFLEDSLHLTEDAYDALTEYVRPRLAAWLAPR